MQIKESLWCVRLAKDESIDRQRVGSGCERVTKEAKSRSGDVDVLVVECVRVGQFRVDAEHARAPDRVLVG